MFRCPQLRRIIAMLIFIAIGLSFDAAAFAQDAVTVSRTIGVQVLPGFRPSNEVNESRSSVAGYLDVEGSVTRWLRLGAAARAEYYTDFGGRLDGKLTARVQPLPL